MKLTVKRFLTGEVLWEGEVSDGFLPQRGAALFVGETPCAVECVEYHLPVSESSEELIVGVFDLPKGDRKVTPQEDLKGFLFSSPYAPGDIKIHF